MIRQFVCSLAFTAAFGGFSANAADLPAYPVSINAVEAEVVAAQPKFAMNTVSDEINLSLVLASMMANADGTKIEGSSSMQGELIILQPGDLPLPKIEIELTGHIIKTVNSTARIDVTIGSIERSFMWGKDEVIAGKFKFTIDDQLADGKVPSFLPVSAIAFVTKEPGGGAVMVSLEEIKVKLAKFEIASAQ